MYTYALRKYDFRGWWSATLQNREWSKKTKGRTALKNGGVSLAVGSCLQRKQYPRLLVCAWSGADPGGTGGPQNFKKREKRQAHACECGAF